MRLLIFAAFICLTAPAVFAARGTPGGALEAIDQLPRGEYKRIARIEARGGTPVPERWHIVTHDPKDENGLHEYVISGGEVVASRSISQFVESVKPEDVLSSGAIKIDSGKVANLAQAYAQVNNVTIASLNFLLKKEGADAAPLWSVSCLDEAGKVIARLVVSAGKGTVISHEGFTAEPGAEAQLETQASTESERRRPKATPNRVVVGRPVATPVPAERKGFFGGMREFFTGKPR